MSKQFGKKILSWPALDLGFKLLMIFCTLDASVYWNRKEEEFGLFRYVSNDALLAISIEFAKLGPICVKHSLKLSAIFLSPDICWPMSIKRADIPIPSYSYEWCLSMYPMSFWYRFHSWWTHWRSTPSKRFGNTALDILDTFPIYVCMHYIQDCQLHTASVFWIDNC